MTQRQYGFSLIELLIVISISVMALALVAPRMSGIFERLELKQLAQKMTNSLQATRSQAISSGRDALWSVDLKNYNFVYGRDLKKISFSKDINVSLITASKEKISDEQANIRFFSDGSATGGELRLSQDKRQYCIYINWLTGRVWIENDKR